MHDTIPVLPHQAGDLLQALRKGWRRTIRIPIHMMETINKLGRTTGALVQELGREPTAEEIANLVDKPASEVDRLLSLNERMSSTATQVGRDGERSVLDTIPDEVTPDPSVSLQNDGLQSNLEGWLSRLNDKQREVVERRFGLHGYENSTLEEVANELGVTRERVRQIQMDALRRLRDILEKDGFSIDSIFK